MQLRRGMLHKKTREMTRATTELVDLTHWPLSSRRRKENRIDRGAHPNRFFHSITSFFFSLSDSWDTTTHYNDISSLHARRHPSRGPSPRQRPRRGRPRRLGRLGLQLPLLLHDLFGVFVEDEST